MKQSGLLSTSEGVLITSKGKSLATKSSLELVTDENGNPVYFNGTKVYRDPITGRLVTEDGKAVINSDGSIVMLDENGNLVDIDGNLVTDPILFSDTRATSLSESFSTLKPLNLDKSVDKWHNTTT